MYACTVGWGDLYLPVFAIGPEVRPEPRKKIMAPARSLKLPDKKFKKMPEPENFFLGSGGPMSSFGTKVPNSDSGNMIFSGFGRSGPKIFFQFLQKF